MPAPGGRGVRIWFARRGSLAAAGSDAQRVGWSYEVGMAMGTGGTRLPGRSGRPGKGVRVKATITGNTKA